MSKIKSSELLQQAKFDTQKIIYTYKNEFLPLSVEALTWQPTLNQWSVLQCIQHLNLTSQHYIPEMQKRIQAAMDSGITSNEDFKRGFIGKRMTKGMKPQEDGTIPNSVKTFSNINPLNLAPIEEVQAELNEFVQYQQDFLDILKKAALTDLNKVKITSLLRFLKLKLGDAIEFYIAHEQRHLLQAQRILQSYQATYSAN